MLQLLRVFAAGALACALSACVIVDPGPKPKLGAWVERSSGTTSSLDKVIWTGTRFVAVGMNGTILTSSDGVTWSKQGFGIWRSVETVAVSDSGRLVAMMSDGVLLLSSDGLEWTEPPTDSTVRFASDIVWMNLSSDSGGGQFVAVGYDGKTATSPDGISWTVRPSGLTGDLYSVAWSGSMLAAVGRKGASSAIVTSPDGVTWTEHVFETEGSVNSVVWSGTGFLAIGDPLLDGQCALFKSVDGTTWSVERVPAFGNLKFMALAKAGGKVLAMGLDPKTGSSLLSSTDGLAWKTEISGYVGGFNAATGNGQRSVVVGLSGEILTSP
ncbi:MAG TPA: hypothetical protein VHO02_00300 [Fibrobacteria bacterium]|nr:hypothetical protein [Fibrobacteria bacterium]